jgi:hypothetical protein
MAFKKAKAEQAALKVGVYGPPGAGKTLTTLLCAEGLAQLCGKRVAFVDTERGTDFYAQAVPERAVHPAAFDFDALYTRSITDVLKEVRALDPGVYGVVVIDSITHIWEAAKAAYSGRMTGVGGIPMQAWGQIKKPYKDLMAFLLSSPLHVFILGRQGNEFDEDEDGQMKKVGVKMKAEGETQYEPHITVRMEALRGRDNSFVIRALVEKDRTGILTGRVIDSPTYETLVKPVVGLLGATQATIRSEDETASQDAEALAAANEVREKRSAELLREFSAKFDLAKTPADVAAVGKAITAEVKKEMTPGDLDALREKFKASESRAKTA